MKKLITICLLIATAFTTNAQDGKPTKEQTVEYLNSVLIFQKGGNYKKYGDDVKYINISKLTRITFENCTLKYNYEYIRTWEGRIPEVPEPILYEESEIDLSTVESFEFKINEMFSDRHYPYNDFLELYYNSKKYGESPTSIYCSPKNTEKVLKALNHLRKLCGAPEPISFD